MLSAEELVAIRAGMQVSMTDVVGVRNVLGYAVTSSGTTPTYSTAVSTVCHYAELSGVELVRVQEIAAEASVEVFLPANTTVYPASQLTITPAEGTSIQLEVLHVSKRTSEFHRRVLCKDYMPMTLTSPASLVTRAANAAASTGWRRLGTLLTTGLHFRETDVIYNSGDSYYYVFNTEGDGNPPGWNSVNVSSWTASGGTATVNFATPHGIPPSGKTYAVVDFTGLVASTGTVGNLNTQNMLCYAPTVMQVVCISNSAGGAITANGSGGANGTAIPVINSQIGLRRSSGTFALTDLTQASGTDYVSRVTLALWYPTIVLVPGATPAQNVWHIFGTNGANSITRRSFTGAYPNAVNVFGTASAVPSLVLGDICIRRNPADNYWYAVGNADGLADIVVYKSASNTDITSGSWTLVSHVWSGIGVPAWAAYAIPDPNIAFVDGRVYLLFTGRATDPTPNSVGIIELNATTFLATGTSAILQDGTAYLSWQNGSPLSDLNFLRCPDGVDRIVGFTGGPTDGTGQGVWGCLELAP